MVDAENLSFGKLSRHIQNETTVHGIYHASVSVGPIKKAFWIAAITAAITMVMYNITLVSVRYYNYPVALESGRQRRHALPFPAVTLCNINPVMRSRWNQYITNHDVFETSEGVNPEDVVGGEQSEYRKKRSLNEPMTEHHCRMVFSRSFTISCPSESVLTVVDGFYGRKVPGSTVCPLVFPFSFWGLNADAIDCVIPNSPAKIASECDMKPSCDLTASDDFFGTGEPCPSTLKYVEITYFCTGSEAEVTPTESILASSPDTTVQIRTPVKQGPTTSGSSASTAAVSSTSTAAVSTTTMADYVSTMTGRSTNAYQTTTQDQTTDAAANLSEFYCENAVSCPTMHAPMDVVNHGTPVKPDVHSSPTTSNSNTNTVTESPPKSDELPVKRVTYQGTERLLETLAGLPTDVKTSLGHGLDSLVLECALAGVPCPSSWFQHFHNPELGNCYTFNSGWNASQRLEYSYKPGHRQGLRLILNIEQAEYVSQGDNIAGAKVVVHSHREPVFPEDEGVTVSTGRGTHMAVRQVEFSRRSTPYRRCMDSDVVNVTLNAYQRVSPVRYSQVACTKTCLQRLYQARCGCSDPSLPALDGHMANSTICSYTNSSQERCRQAVRTEHDMDQMSCSCPAVCHSTIYSPKLFTSQWPSDVTKSQVLRKLATKVPWLFSNKDDPDMYKRNLIKLEIFFADFNVDITKEYLSYTFGKYMSSIGGIIGLWLGCSLFTGVEYVAFFWECIKVTRRKHGLSR